MCFCDSCYTPYAVCKPTDRAIWLGRMLFWMMCVLFVLQWMMCVLFVLQWMMYVLFVLQWMIVERILVVMGCYSVHCGTAYNIELIGWVTIGCCFMCVKTVIDFFVIVLGLSSTSFAQIPFIWVWLFGCIILYLASCITAKKLYGELRTNYCQTKHPSCNCARVSYLCCASDRMENVYQLQGIAQSEAEPNQIDT
eukprot:295859_1